MCSLAGAVWVLVLARAVSRNDRGGGLKDVIETLGRSLFFSVRIRVRKMIDTSSDVSRVAKYLVQYQYGCDYHEIIA